MKVLVTGATGFVGQHLIPQLLESGHEVTAVARDRVKARSFDWYKRVLFMAQDIHHDIADPFEFFGRPDAIVHLAWGGLPNYKALFHFEETLPRDYRFLKTLVEGGARHLLVTGTCLEYGMQNGCLSEEMASRPVTSYALAKDTLFKSLEMLIQDKGLTFQWARLFYMYGPGQNPNSLLSQLDRALGNGDSTFNMSGGDQLRDYLPAITVAAQLVKLLVHPECSGIVNVCSGVPISVRSVIERQLTERQAKIRLNLGHYPYPEYEPMAFWGNPRKFLSIIGDDR